MTGATWTLEAQGGGSVELPFGGRGAFAQVFSGETEEDYFLVSFIPFRKGADADSSLQSELSAESPESVEAVSIPGADFAVLKTDELDNSAVMLRRGRVVSVLVAAGGEIEKPQLLRIAGEVSERLAGFPRVTAAQALTIKPRIETASATSLELNALGDHCYVHALWLTALQLGEDDGDGWLRGAGEIAVGVTVREQYGRDGCSLAREVPGEPEVGTFVRKDIELHPGESYAFGQARLFSHLGPEHPHPESVIAVIVKDRDDRGVLEWASEIVGWAAKLDALRKGDDRERLETIDQVLNESLERERLSAQEIGTFEDVQAMRGDVLGEGMITFSWPHARDSSPQTFEVGSVWLTFLAASDDSGVDTGEEAP